MNPSGSPGGLVAAAPTMTQQMTAEPATSIPLATVNYDGLIGFNATDPYAITPESRSFVLSTQIQILMCLFYGTLAFTAVASNMIVCYIVLSNQRMRTATNYFIVNLAVGDILMALLCIPFTFPSNLLFGYWPFGLSLCVIVSYSQANSVFISAYTMVAISIDKYLAIMYPMRLRMSKIQAKIIILVIWSAALLTSLPTALLSHLSPVYGDPAGSEAAAATTIAPARHSNSSSFLNSTLAAAPASNNFTPAANPIETTTLAGQQEQRKYSCQESWNFWPIGKYYYSMALMILQFVLPLFVLVITYSQIVLAVWGKKMPGEEDNARDARMARSKRKMIKMVIFCVIAFALTWLPFNALIIIGDVRPEIWENQDILYIWFITHYLAMCHTITNPLIYIWMNNRFRAGFKQTIEDLYRTSKFCLIYVIVNVCCLGMCGLNCCCKRKYMHLLGKKRNFTRQANAQDKYRKGNLNHGNYNHATGSKNVASSNKLLTSSESYPLNANHAPATGNSYQAGQDKLKRSAASNLTNNSMTTAISLANNNINSLVTTSLVSDEVPPIESTSTIESKFEKCPAIRDGDEADRKQVWMFKRCQTQQPRQSASSKDLDPSSSSSNANKQCDTQLEGTDKTTANESGKRNDRQLKLMERKGMNKAKIMKQSHSINIQMTSRQYHPSSNESFARAANMHQLNKADNPTKSSRGTIMAASDGCNGGNLLKNQFQHKQQDRAKRRNFFRRRKKKAKSIDSTVADSSRDGLCSNCHANHKAKRDCRLIMDILSKHSSQSAASVSIQTNFTSLPISPIRTRLDSLPALQLTPPTIRTALQKAGPAFSKSIDRSALVERLRYVDAESAEDDDEDDNLPAQKSLPLMDRPALLSRKVATGSGPCELDFDESSRCYCDKRRAQISSSIAAMLVNGDIGEARLLHCKSVASDNNINYKYSIASSKLNGSLDLLSDQFHDDEEEDDDDDDDDEDDEDNLFAEYGDGACDSNNNKPLFYIRMSEQRSSTEVGAESASGALPENGNLLNVNDDKLILRKSPTVQYLINKSPKQETNLDMEVH